MRETCLRLVFFRYKTNVSRWIKDDVSIIFYEITDVNNPGEIVLRKEGIELLSGMLSL